MTSKEFVKSIFPNAFSEKHKKGKIKGLQETYWIIKHQPNTMYISYGTTESKAWKNAKEKIIEDELV